MKRSLSVLVLTVMLLSLLLSGIPAFAQEDIYEVVMQYPTLGNTPQDLKMVEDKINERIEKEIGVHLTLFPASAFTLNNTTSLMVSSNEKLDLAMSMFEGGVGGYVNKGMLLELDDLVKEYGQDILAAEGLAMSGGYFNGKLYGIPTEEKMGRVKAFHARKDLVDKYNIAYDPDHIYTYEEMSEIFATIKAGEGEKFYPVAANPNEDPIFTYFDMLDTLGATLASGGLLNYGVNEDTVVNYFASDAFKRSADVARSWYQAGYLAPDANTATDSALAQFQSGNYFGFFSNSEPDMVIGHSATARDFLNTEIVPFRTSAPSAMTQFYQLTLWMIPITCENPEKTMQLLNLFYKDQELINLVYHGIEGVHWNFVEGSDTVVDWPEGVNGANATYMTILNVWGDKSKDYVRVPNDASYYQKLADFNASIKPEYTSSALGYNFDSSPVRTQFAAVADTISQYQVSLGMGVVDPAAVLPEFLNALEVAGINDIIAENQRQFDAWKASK